MMKRDAFWYEGTDPQGIIWGSEDFPESREVYRTHSNARMDYFSHRGEHHEISDPLNNKQCKFFKYTRNYPVPCEVGHPQLRNNVHYVNNESLFIKCSYNRIIRYNPITQTEVTISNPDFSSLGLDAIENYLLLVGTDSEVFTFRCSLQPVASKLNQNIARPK